MPTLAGILDIVGGAAALFGFLIFGFIGSIVVAVPEADEFPLPLVAGLFGCLSLIFVALGVVAIVGGAFALQRRRWGWAVVGAVAAALACPPMGVPAIVLTVLAERDLREGATPT